MRIGIRAHDVAYAPLNELIPNIHNQGFHCMHIALSKSIKEFKPGVETMTPGLAMYIKELCAGKMELYISLIWTMLKEYTGKMSAWILIIL